MDTNFVGWRKTGRSNLNNCVEVGNSTDSVGVRDTKDRNGPVLSFDNAAWTAFLKGIKN